MLRNFKDPQRQKMNVHRQEFIKRPPGGARPKAPHLSNYRETEDGLPYIAITDLSHNFVGKLYLSKTPNLLYRVYLVGEDVRGGPYQDYNDAVWRCFEIYRNKEKLKAYLRKNGKLID